MNRNCGNRKPVSAVSIYNKQLFIKGGNVWGKRKE